MLNMNIITINNHRSKLIDWCPKMPNLSYYRTLQAILTKKQFIMKKTLFTIGLTFLIGFTLSSQDFISEDKQWNVRLFSFGTYTEVFKIEGDSTFNSLNYKKIWMSGDSLASWYYKGLLREESNVVYYVPPNTSEGVLYDFNLEIGDTTYVKNAFCGDEEIPIYVVDIDTVEYFGIPRKRWHLGENGYTEEFWVEGIGSLFGPLYTNYDYNVVCPVWDLLCYHKDDELLYILPGQVDCFQGTVGVESIKELDDISIKPNPVKKGNTIYLETNSVPNSISIFNSSGLLIKRLNQIRDKIIRIETNDFKPGMYFITIQTIGGRIKTQKIMIE